MKDIKVCKFGGTSMATRESINRVIDIVSADDRRKFVIVSAPGKRNKYDIKVTDQLYKIVEEQKTTGNFKESFDALKERFVSLTKELGVDLTLFRNLTIWKRQSQTARRQVMLPPAASTFRQNFFRQKLAGRSSTQKISCASTTAACSIQNTPTTRRKRFCRT